MCPLCDDEANGRLHRELIALDDAIETVARRLVASTAEHHAGEEWENHPDIGQHDWERIESRASMITSELDVPQDKYERAYQFLADRAERP